MRILHGHWVLGKGLAIWGEDGGPTPKPPAPHGASPKRWTSKPHPAALSEKDLQALLPPGITGPGNLTLRLPTLGKTVLSSLHPPPLEGGVGNTVRLLPWEIPCVMITAGVEFLVTLPPDPPPGFRLGDSLHFLVEAARFALETVVRGKVLPALEKAGEGWEAHWRPVWDEERELERMKTLAFALPPVLRAEALGQEDDPSAGLSPQQTVRTITGEMLDSLARTVLGGKRLSKAEMKRQARTERSLGERWADALSSENAVVPGGANELSAFGRGLKSWLGGIAGEAGSPLRTCLRLAESTVENGSSQPWRLEFLLQARDDRSLLIPAGTVWKTKSKTMTWVKRSFENPQERLLGDLGKALRVCPLIEPSLKTARPAGMDLEPAQAYEFLREYAAALEQTGFGVIVPPWWRKPGGRLNVSLKVKSKGPAHTVGGGHVGLDAICAYAWTISLGDTEISFEEFQRLATMKVPLVQVRGQWVELRPEEVEKAIAFFQQRGTEGEMTLAEALRLGTGLAEAPTGLPVGAVRGEGWLQEFLGGATEKKLAPMRTPEHFQGTLRPYQERGLAWLNFLGSLGLGACLADDMGLGKTIQLLSLLVQERADEVPKGKKKKAEASPGTRLAPTLLVCPVSVLGNWKREAAKFAPDLRVHLHHGGDRLSGEALEAEITASDLVLTSYSMLTRDREAFAAQRWGRIVLDEAQYIKNAETKQAKAVLSVGAAQRVALTGTPVENRLSELWSIMEFLNPGLLGSASGFRKTFATPIERYRDQEKAELLKKATSPFILRRLKSDKSIISDLPDKVETREFCTLTPEQATLYQAVVEDLLLQVEEAHGIERRGKVLAGLSKLKQICNHPAHFLKDASPLPGRSGKLARLEELAAEITTAGEKTLCFTQFTEMGDLLSLHLAERIDGPIFYLHGQVQQKKRDEMVRRFQETEGPAVFLPSLKAGGTGLNLTAANHVVHFDRWWNPAVENQATDRAYRIGQKRNVQVRKFVCQGTIEERIDAMITEKKDLAERIVGTGEDWLTELSTADLRKFVALSADAVGGRE